MLRSDFENHDLWAVLDACQARAKQILDEQNPTDIAPIEAMTFYVEHIQSFRASGGPISVYFTELMLADMRVVFDGVVNRLDNRINTGDPSYSEAARNQAETSLNLLGPWPRPALKGARAGHPSSPSVKLSFTRSFRLWERTFPSNRWSLLHT